MERKYNYFYKITNNLNGKYYYGIHSTDNLEDGYMGSGILLKKAIKKYGTDFFSKEILKFFNTRKEAAAYEEENVTMTLVENEECYNIIPGGETFPMLNMTTVFDKIDEEYKLISCKEFAKNRERYKAPGEKKIVVKEIGKENDTWYIISTEEYKTNKDKYITTLKGKYVVRDNKDNVFVVDKNDERLKNGKLKFMFQGKKHDEEWRKKVKEKFATIKHQQGEKNSQYGTMWINKDNVPKKIKKEEFEKYQKDGWEKGKKHKEKKQPKIPQYKLIDSDLVFNLHDEEHLTWKEISEKIGVSIHVIEKFLRWKRYS